jgi:hypothetical protein
MNWLTSRSAPLVALAALALASCDTGTDLNVDLPDATAVSTEYKDIPLTVSTVRLAPVQTLNTAQFLAGRLGDNVAGTTTAAAYFNVIDAAGINTVLLAGQTAPTDTLPSAFVAPALDSVVFVTGFDQVYGSATTPAKFDIFRLAAPLDERQVYDSSTPAALGLPIAQNLISRLDRTQKVATTAVDATTTTPAIPAGTAVVADPTVRLLLQRTEVLPAPGRPAVSAVNSQFATELFAKLTTRGFTQTQLDDLLKGIALLPSAGHNSSIVSFVRGFKSRVLVYYHSDASRHAFSSTYSIYFGPAYSAMNSAYTARDPRYFTTIDNVLPPALAALAARSGSVPADVLGGASYVQDGIGLATRVLMRGHVTLKRLVGSADTTGIVINRAEFLVPVKPFSNAVYSNPSQLFAVEVDANNNVLQRTINFLPTDRVVQADGANQQGSGYSTVGPLVSAGTQPYYAIPVTAYMQAYFYNNLGGAPAALVLTPSIRSSSTLTLNRAAIDAANVRLRVYYSKKR